MPSRFEHDDLSHYEVGAGTADLPPQRRRRLSHLTDLCRFATSVPSGPPRKTAIRCSRRPERRPCEGLLVVRLRDLPRRVEWECPACGAAGRITGWEATDADLRDLEVPRDSGSIRIEVTRLAHEALRAVAPHHAKLAALAYTTEVDAEDRIWLDVPRVQLDDCAAELLRHATAADGTQLGGRLLTLALHFQGSARAADDEPSPAFLEITGDSTQDLLTKLLGFPDLRAIEFVPTRKPRPRSTVPAALARSTYRIKVDLQHVRPPVWRRLLVPGGILLPDLHRILQGAMGWHDAHLHLFVAGDYSFAPPRFELEDAEDSTAITLAELAPREGTRLSYEYDFGDGWMHRLVVEAILPDPCETARCIKGRRACPPEDFGGPHAYARLLAALADPSHPEREELRERVPLGFDPDEFDLMAADARVREASRRTSS